MRRNDAMGAVAELAASQHGAFTRTQAADRGLSRRQIHDIAVDATIAEPIRGVLVFRAAPATWKQRMIVATLASPGYHAAFRAAAYLHWLDGFQQPPRPEIIGRRGTRALRGLDLVQHWVEPIAADDLVTIAGISCTGLARIVIDVAGLGDADLAPSSAGSTSPAHGSCWAWKPTAASSTSDRGWSRWTSDERTASAPSAGIPALSAGTTPSDRPRWPA